MTGWSAVNARTLSATATAATVPAVTFKNCLRDKNMGHTSYELRAFSKPTRLHSHSESLDLVSPQSATVKKEETNKRLANR